MIRTSSSSRRREFKLKLRPDARLSQRTPLDLPRSFLSILVTGVARKTTRLRQQ